MQIPSWLDVEFLKKVRAEDKEMQQVFSNALPYYYAEIAQLLLAECEESFNNPKQVRSVLEDIQEVRKEKLNRILRKIDPATPAMFLSAPGNLELN